MYTITKSFAFSAAHRLDHLGTDHQCYRLHGHNYTVTVELAADRLDADGFVVDYGSLDWFKDMIDRDFDHRYLNDVLGSGIKTTAENLAAHFYGILRVRYGGLVTAVTVSETPKTTATYRPGSVIR